MDRGGPRAPRQAGHPRPSVEGEGDRVNARTHGPLHPREEQRLVEGLLAGDEEAIRTADAIIIGPGSVYTSIVPNFLVKGVAEAVGESRAIKTYVCNVMTQPGETTDFTASDHVSAVLEQAGVPVFDYVLVNSEEPTDALKDRYAGAGSRWVEPDVDKIDLSKDLKPLWSPPKGKFVAVDVPKLQFLMIDGTGDPNNAQSYKDALNALYSVAYTAKFMLKLGPRKIDFRVMPLEGLWWSDDMDDFRKARKDRWKWTAMIALPDAVTKADIKAAIGGSAFAIFHNQGQACIAGSRLLLHEKIADEFLDGFLALAKSIRLGNPLDPKTEMGPLTSAQHRDRVQTYCQIAHQEGGEVLRRQQP